MKKLIIIILSVVLAKTTIAQLVIRNAIISNPVFFDNFNQGYTTGNIGGQRHWTDIQNNLAVSGGAVSGATSGADICACRSETFSANQYSQIIVTSIEDHGYIGVAVRCSAGINYYGYYATDDGRYFFKYVSGVLTQIAHATAITTNIGDVLRIEVQGSTIRCYLNSVLDTSLPGGTGIFTDTSITTGAVGICASRNYAMGGDNWSGGNL